MRHNNLILLFLLIMCGKTACTSVNWLEPIGTPIILGNVIFSTKWCGCNLFGAAGAYGVYGIIQLYSFNTTTEALEPIGTTTALGTAVYSLAWCPSCTFLAAGGKHANGLIQMYSFDPLLPGNLERVGSTTTIGDHYYAVGTVDWCHECQFLAASVFSTTCANPPCPSLIQVYSFDPENPGDLVRVGTTQSIDNDFIYALKWCGDCQHLAAAGDRVLYIYSFDPENPGDLVLSATVEYNSYTYAIDWCGSCSYLAVGGQDHTSNYGSVFIYHFDAQSTPSLSLVTTLTIPYQGALVRTVKWCQGCDNLTIGGNIGATGMLAIYHFDQLAGTLSLEYGRTMNFIVNSVDWCDDCEHLVAGGLAENPFTGFIQLLKASNRPDAPTNLSAQQISHRFPTQLDIINQLCWNAVTGAVAYKVYADAALTILLATITDSLCFSQHQIRAGASATYYVTAVDAQGNKSAPAVITV